MGRFLLLIVAAISVAGSMYAVLGNETQTESARRQATSEEATLARQAAQSGLEVGLGAIVADYDARPSATAQPLDAAGAHGAYSLRSEDTPQGTVGLEARGVVDGAEHVVTAEVLELLPVGAAVTAHADRTKLELSSDARIEGEDRRAGTLPGLAGPAGEHVGVRFGTATLAAAAQWGGTGTANVSGDPATGTGPTPAALRAIAEAGAAAPTITAADYTLDDAVVGSPVTPVVVFATNKATLKGDAVGYGLLVVDGDFTMEGDARWEGLVVIRATANEKRKVTLKDDAVLIGALVLLGSEFIEESGGSDGFPDGHMDLDIFEGPSNPMGRSYHQHEWDDRYDLTYIDFFTAPDIGPSFTDFLAANPTKTFTATFHNAHNSAGSYTITQGTATTTGRTEDGFSGPIEVATLSALRVSFDALCSLRGTTPGRVKDGGSNRDGSFTVRFYDGTTPVYAVTAYEHAPELREGGPACTASGAPAASEDSDPYGEFELKMESRAAVLYSEEAAGRVGRALAVARDRTRKLPVILRSVPTD